MKKNILLFLAVFISVSLVTSTYAFDLCEHIFPSNVTLYNQCNDYFSSLNSTRIMNITNNITNNITRNITYNLTNNITVYKNITIVKIINSSQDVYSKEQIDSMFSKLYNSLNSKPSQFDDIAKLLIYKQLGLGNFSNSQSQKSTDPFSQLKEILSIMALLKSGGSDSSNTAVTPKNVSVSQYPDVTSQIQSLSNTVSSSISQVNNEISRQNQQVKQWFIYGLFFVLLGFVAFYFILKIPPIKPKSSSSYEGGSEDLSPSEPDDVEYKVKKKNNFL